MAEERERDNPANDPEAQRGKKGFLNKEWLKKHWIELVAAGAGVIGVLFLFMRGSGSSRSATPLQTSAPATTPAPSGSSGSGAPADLSPVTDALATLNSQEQALLQALQNIGNQDAASQQTLAAELAAVQAEIAGLNGTGTPGSSSGSFPNTINPIFAGNGPLPGSYTPLLGGGSLINVPAPGGRTGTTVTAGPTAVLSPVGAVASGGTLTLPPSIPNVSSGYGPVIVPVPAQPTGATGQIQTPPAPPPSPIVAGQNPTRPGAPPIPS